MKFTWIILLSCLSISVCAQPKLDLDKKKAQAARAVSEIEIDAVLDEESWKNAPVSTGFTTLQPNPGLPASQRTEVRILYDNTGLYIAAYLYDENPDGIQMELSERDDLGNTDWFGIYIDAYRGGINGVSFILTPAGVQRDSKYSAFGQDRNWDAVWESAARITNRGWIAEIRIPYAAIRFPRAEEQVWGINFGRSIQRENQRSYWNAIDPQIDGFLNQAGYLRGIRNITPPIRLQATPFLAVYGQHYHDQDDDPVNSFGQTVSGGMDVKYGISDAFTLDMTLIPDFGESQSDNQVLNLSPFEVRFSENRQFFTEGTELFNKGGLFYSRRIGGRPNFTSRVSSDQLLPEEELVSLPAKTQLFNATKVSGRTPKGLGIGVFNATSGKTFATVRSDEGGEREVLVDPLTNYSVFVLDQNLPNNSFATLINTTVLRDGEFYDANVTGAVANLRNKAQSVEVEGSYKLSQQYYNDSVALGHAFNVGIEKISGNFNFGASYNEESDTYDINDLGFLSNNNERSARLSASYRQFDPFLIFNNARIGTTLRYRQLYNPGEYTGFNINFWSGAEFKNFWNFNLWGNFEPVATYDFFEPRVDGRFYRNPTYNRFGFWMGTDGRKRLRLSGRITYNNYGEVGRNDLSRSFSTRFRVNDKLNMRAEFELTDRRGDVGYVRLPQKVRFIHNTNKLCW